MKGRKKGQAPAAATVADEDRIHLDDETTRKLARRLAWVNLTGTDKAQGEIPGGTSAQAADLLVLVRALTYAGDVLERESIAQAVAEAVLDEIDEAWVAVDEAVLKRQQYYHDALKREGAAEQGARE